MSVDDRPHDRLDGAGPADDADAGPNGLQNRPVLTSATTTTIAGILDSKLDTPFTVRFFSQGVGNEGKRL